MTWGCLGVAIAFLVADTADLAQIIYERASDASGSGACPPIAEADWAVAFAAGECWGDVQVEAGYPEPSLLRSALFDAYAYLLQTAVLFLALLMVTKLGQFFYFVSRLFDPDQEQYRIEPMWDDPLQRLGLTPLGKIYNFMLSLLLAFEGYVAVHRLQQITFTKGIGILTYTRELIDAISTPSRWFDPSLHHFDTIDLGTWFTLIVIAPPVLIICWFPLLKIRSYIQERRIELTKAYALERKRAKAEGNLEAIAELERRARFLEAANVWPSGDRTAQTLCSTDDARTGLGRGCTDAPAPDKGQVAPPRGLAPQLGVSNPKGSRRSVPPSDPSSSRRIHLNPVRASRLVYA